MKNLIRTYLKAAAIILVSAILSYSCRKDDDDYTLLFSSPAAYMDYGQTQTFSFRRSGNVAKLSITSSPEGWKSELNISAGTVTVTAPESLDEYEENDETVTPAEHGTLVLRGYVGDKAVSTSIFLSLSDMVDLSSTYANSYILDKPMNGYQISTRRPDGSAVEGVASAEIVWMSSRYLIRYVELRNDKITFATYSDSDDQLLEGNALLAVKDADGNILWCWHLWVTGGEPEAGAVQLNGYTFMGCNLGAFGCSTEDEDAILDSYGLYYQWGRPTPFARPYYYDCAGSNSETLYNSEVVLQTMRVEPSDSANSDIAAAIADPMVFVTDLTEPWSGSSTTTWSDSSKSIYDPCPAGWRVPTDDAFAGLRIVAAELENEPDQLDKAYGWTLTDGVGEAFFFAGGRRSYLDGSVINMNTQETPKPWEGFYWTTTLNASRRHGTALFFDLNTVSAESSRLTDNRQMELSNGLQVRCVRVQ